jgi:adenylate kinase family enzyme
MPGSPVPPRRVSVVGNSGSGKSALARMIAARLGVPYVELDALFHLPGWKERPLQEFKALIDERTAAGGWVVDGNYRLAVTDLVWPRADTLVWLDLPRSLVMRQVIGRTLRRVVSREELWNGNREPWSNLYRFDPQRSIIRWTWTQHGKYHTRYEAAMTDPALAHLTGVRLRSHAEAAAWVNGLPRQ